MLYTEEFTVRLKYIKHYSKFWGVGVSDLSLDETKQYVTRRGNGQI